jgi:cell wall-associated NlpC family hydrolase
MRLKSAVTMPWLLALALWAVGLQATAQQSARPDFAATKSASPAAGARSTRTARLLTPDDGMAVISAALDTQRRFASNRDCSHLVHAIYERAGFPYVYANADDLYDGVEHFRRVFHPQAGDLIVWRGHVGIIVRPSRHVFFSFLSAGPGTDNYQSPYWVGRGEARFYRYLRN